MISANGGLPAHRYTPQVTQRWPRGSEPASEPEIKEAVLRGAGPLQLYRFVAHHAPEPGATIRHMQLTAVKRADAQLRHCVQVYTQEAQQTSHDSCTYYNLLIHYQHVQPSD